MQKNDAQKRAKEDILRRIRTEEDYIRCKRFSNSLNKFVSKFTDGSEDAAIARVLMIPEEQVQAIYAEAVRKLREEMLQNEEE